MMDESPPEKVGEIRKWLNVIKRDFAPILTILIIAIPLIWWVINSLYKTQLDAKDAQLASKDDQIKLVERERDDFRNKTGTSTPDEAKAKIEALTAKVHAFEARISGLEPRRLKASEREQFRKNTQLPPNVHYEIVVSFDMSCADCKSYADDFVAILQTPEVGWNVQEPSILAPIGPIPLTGIAVYIDNPSNPSSAVVTLQRALDAAKIKYNTIYRRPRPQVPVSRAPLMSKCL